MRYRIVAYLPNVVSDYDYNIDGRDSELHRIDTEKRGSAILWMSKILSSTEAPDNYEFYFFHDETEEDCIEAQQMEDKARGISKQEIQAIKAEEARKAAEAKQKQIDERVAQQERQERALLATLEAKYRSSL